MATLTEIMQRYADTIAETLSEKAARVVPVVPGIAGVWEDVCGGFLYGRVISSVPQVGPKGSGTGPCGIMAWDHTLGFSIVRCVATINDRGQAPSIHQISADGERMLADKDEMIQAILDVRYTRLVQTWFPLGVEGGVAGGEWQFTIRIPFG